VKTNKLVLLSVAAIVLYYWATSRIPRMADYQTPPHPIMHGNYYSYHDMSEQWDQGKRPGTLNMTKNGQYNLIGNPYADYAKFQPLQKQEYFCDFYDLDIGFLFPIDLARRLFGVLPDNYLRTVAFQLLVDILAAFAIFTSLIGWGLLPATGSALLYATNVAIGTQVSLAFYYFWDAVTALAALLAIVSLHRTARRRFDWASVALAIVLGAILGFGIWLRSSWAAYSFVLVALLLFSRTMRKYAPITAVVLLVCASYPIVRASRLLGHPAVTTRQSWSAAFEALGKDPNPYGLENDDQYLFDVAREKYGAVDDNCQGTKRDAALKKEYQEIWRKDRAFIIRSIANRMYLGFLSNGARQDDVGDRNALILAVIGCGWMVLRGGARRWLAIPAATLFVVSVASIGLVYFVTAHYNGVSQVCLVLLAAGTFDLMGYFLPRSFRFAPLKRRAQATWRLMRLRRWYIAGAVVALALIAAILNVPRVHGFLNPPVFAVEWFPPAELAPERVAEHVAKIRHLPPAERQPLLDTLQVSRDADDAALTTALRAYLKHLWGQNVRDNITRFDLDLATTFAPKAQQALWHSEHFVLGFTVDQAKGFDVADPSTWSGRVLAFRVKQPADPAAFERAVPVFVEKFERRGLVLESRQGNSFVFRERVDGGGASAAPLTRELDARRQIDGGVVGHEEVFQHMQARLGHRAIAAGPLADVVRVLLRVGVGVGGRDGVGDEAKDVVIENAVAHEDHVGGIVLRANPLFAIDRADQVERERHVLDDPLPADREAFAVAGDEPDVQVRLEQRQTVMIVRSEHFHELAVGGVIERARRHHAVDVENEDLWRPHDALQKTCLRLSMGDDYGSENLARGPAGRRWRSVGSIVRAAARESASSRSAARGFRGRRSNSPHDAVEVVGHQQRAVRRDCDAGGLPADGAFGTGIADEPGHEVFVYAGRTALDPPHAEHFVPGQDSPVPRAMTRDEDVAAILRRELRPVIECEPHRRGVRLEQHVGDDDRRSQLGMPAGKRRILIRAGIEPRPAVESAALDRRDEVGRQVVADQVAFVDRGPQVARHRIDADARRVANTGSVDVQRAALGRRFENVGAVHFGIDVDVVDVRSRSDRDEQRPFVERKRDVARPVAIGRQLRHDRLGGVARAQVAVPVPEPDDRIGVADVHEFRLRSERKERDAERHPQSGRERLDERRPVLAHVAEDFDPARFALGDEHVAVRRAPDDPRVLEARHVFFDGESVGHARPLRRKRGPVIPDDRRRVWRRKIGRRDSVPGPGRGASVVVERRLGVLTLEVRDRRRDDDDRRDENCGGADACHHAFTIQRPTTAEFGENGRACTLSDHRSKKMGRAARS